MSAISEKLVKDALAALNWADIQSALDRLTDPGDAIEEVMGHALRFSEWINKYPNEKKAKKRQAFLDAFRGYVEQRLGTEQAMQIAELAATIALIESGYHGIVGMLGMAKIGQAPADIQVWSLIHRALIEFHLMNRMFDAQLRKSPRVSATDDPRLINDEGIEFSMSGGLESICDAVSNTATMEAIKGKWFNAEDQIVLPPVVVTDEPTNILAGSHLALATFWRNWNRLERRRRFLGGRLLKIEGDEIRKHVEFPDEPLDANGSRAVGDHQTKLNTLIRYVPSSEGEAEILDFLANRRLEHRFNQTFAEMSIEIDLTKHEAGIDTETELPPAALVSPIEGHAAVTLSEMLGYPIVHDVDETEGLRLLEWVRGYAVLRCLAESRTKGAADASGLLLVMDHAELVGILDRCGLKGGKAEKFVSLVTLHRKSRDMFDCPLIAIQGGKLLVFTPALLHVRIPEAVLSNISTRGEQIGKKGSAFEASFRDELSKHGLLVKHFKFYEGNDEYEYDAVAIFDSHIFIFECKNHSLSGGEPSEAYHFDLGIAGKARQARRLADALQRHPEVIEEHFGKEHVGKPIVTCVVHSLPYARLGDIDGVYFSDQSALSRFFNNRNFNIVVPHFLGKHRVLHRTAVKDVWGADKPTPAALIAQLETPFQLELLAKHLEAKEMDFPVSPDTFVLTRYLSLKPMTSDSVATAMGVDAKWVDSEIQQVADIAKEIRAKLPPPKDEDGC